MESSTELELTAMVDPPPVAGLILTLQPGSVFASTASTLALTVSVPLNGASVAMTPQNGIAVTFPVTGGTATPLVTTLNGITTTPPSSAWAVRGPQSGKFIVYPVNPTTLLPGTSLQFQFRSLPIVSDTGTPNVLLNVTTGAGSGQTSLPIAVQALVPGVIAWADPPMVGLNTLSTLRWVSNGGTKVRVLGYSSGSVPSGYKDFPVGGATNTQVNPTLDSGVPPKAYTYQVMLLSEPGDQQQGATILVTVFLHSPYIAQFGFIQEDDSVGPAITIAYGDSVTAQWNCVFVNPTQGVAIAYGSTSVRNAPVNQMIFDPKDALPPNDNKVPVTLTAPGWNQPASETHTVTYEPIQILYFKYLNWTGSGGPENLSNISWLIDPEQPQSQSVGPDPAYPAVQRLQVGGPGGPFTQYLGNGSEPYLEIRYFSPSAPVKSGTAFTLQWFTANATSLTLTTPAGTIQIATGQIAQGTSQPYTISSATDYVLTAVGAGGTVKSYLTITPS
jgi:hypothetical protein